MTTFAGKAIRWIGYTIAVIIIMAATAVSATELLSPYLNDRRDDFAHWASDLLGIPITISHVKIAWRHIKPVVVLENVDVISKQTQKPTFEIQTIKINIRIIQSLLQRKLLAEDIRIYGVNLTIHQKKSGQLNVAGLDNFVFQDNFTGNTVAGNAMSTWIFSQPHLALRHIEIHFIPDVGTPRSVTLATLNLRNSKSQHVLKGSATLNQKNPSQVEVNLSWQGDSSDVLNSATHAEVYLNLSNIALSEWLSQKSWKSIQVQQGTTNSKVWLTWDHGRMQQVRSQFQLSALQLISLTTKKTVIIPRFNGEVNWRQGNNSQYISGRNILLDFPDHIWPTTDFTLVVTPAETTPHPPLRRQAGNYALQASYLDLADANQLASASGLLPNSTQKLLVDLNPKGQLRKLNLTLSDDFSQTDKNTYATQFSHLTVNPWQELPGVINLTGKFSWNAEQGSLILNSKKSTLTLNSVFATPLSFDLISGDIELQKQAQNTWDIHAKNFSVANEDIFINTNMNLLLPQNESPTIDLTGDFSVPHVAKFVSYLPLKKMEPALNEWLQNRFQGGQLTSGKIDIQGKLTDFNSEENAAKFKLLVSTKIKDLDFEYAPGWPMVHHVNGSLVFAGHSMTADMESGQLYNVPIKMGHGYIPYLGPNHPQILDLKVAIDGDLAQGLRFIDESPLRDTIGKDLAGMKLSGAMGLKLAFSIPVKTPALSKVIGDVTTSSGTLMLPSWHLTLDHMIGALRFTEDSIQINQMQGRLFDEPVSLSINTIIAPKKPPIVQAVLQGKISQPLLDKWLSISSEQFIQGSAPYAVELNILSQKYAQGSQLIISSNLNGLAINLPGIYGKTANETRDFKLSANLKLDQPFQTKIEYGKLLTAALTLKQVNQKWQFQGGELRLGSNGQANWQTQPGILVTGQVANLDWNMWHNYFASLASDEKNKNTANNSFAQYLRGVDIVADKFPIVGQNLTKVRVQVTPDQNAWKIGVTSSQATGQVTIPTTPGATIQANFQHLFLAAAENQQANDPRTIPAFSFEGDDVRYKDQAIGHVVLEGVPAKAGLRITKLNIFTDIFDLNAKGDWISPQKNKNQTNLSGILTTNNVSKFLEHWDLGSPNLIANEGNITFDVSWLDTPYKPSLPTLSGSLFLKLGKGKVINLGSSTDTKLGFGRMLNILNLQTLPRRLSLDFTDVFDKGYNFDVMQGHFDLDNGSATTKDTYFAGPIARIEIQGRIGIAAKDYDIMLSVTPYVTGSIPLVATLAGGPIVGAVSWLVEKAASGVVSKAATYHYSIKGPWDNPIWEKTN